MRWGCTCRWERGKGPHPCLRPTMYEAGAGVDKNASMFSFDAIAIRFAELEASCPGKFDWK